MAYIEKSLPDIIMTLGMLRTNTTNIFTRTSRENDKGLYATMIGGRIDPSSCLDTCWVDNMAVWWFRATCFHGLKYLCVNRPREVLAKWSLDLLTTRGPLMKERLLRKS